MPTRSNAPRVAHDEQERVPAAREQADERRLERVGAEVERRDVAVEVVDRDERAGRRAQAIAFAAESPTSSAPTSPGPCVTATRSIVVERHVRLVERRADHRRDELEVASRGDLGHDAAVARVQARLRRDDVRADLALSGDDSAAAVSSHDVSMPEDHAAPLVLGLGVAPHDQRVLTVVGVVAAADVPRATNPNDS